MESVQFGSEVSDVQEELVRLNLKILSMIDSFINIECQAEMDSLNGEIRAKLDLMRKGVENLRSLARQQLNPESAVMLKTDANSHEDQMTGCHLAFKKANIACMSRLNSKGRENLMSKVSVKSVSSFDNIADKYVNQQRNKRYLTSKFCSLRKNEEEICIGCHE